MYQHHVPACFLLIQLLCSSKFSRYTSGTRPGTPFFCLNPLIFCRFDKHVPELGICSSDTGTELVTLFYMAFDNILDNLSIVWRIVVMPQIPDMIGRATTASLDSVLGIVLLPALTDAQLSALRAIHGFVLERSMYPTQRELAAIIGCSQPNAVQYIDALTKKGYLVRDLSTNRRNIRLTELAIKKLDQLKEEPNQANLF
jgi:DNA-binding MarR family transcriptional regulator